MISYTDVGDTSASK